MEENKKKQAVDIFVIWNRIWQKKKLFCVVGVVSFILACLWNLPMPRYYQCQVVLAPENTMNDNGLMGNVAAMMGFNTQGQGSGDAIYPELYPKVLSSNDFIQHLININVQTIDGQVDTTYYTYKQKYQKGNPVVKAVTKVPKAIFSLFKKKEEKGKSSSKGVDLFNLTKEQTEVFTGIRQSIGCSVEMKTGLITITVTDQDPLICATIADSVRTKLQAFITEYRTNKARNDVEYYKKLTVEAKLAYEKARQGYGSYADQNTDVVMQSYKLKESDLENDMQLKFNAYSAMRNQLQLAEAKLQERTPAFTVIQGATVPQSPAGPKKKINIIIFVLFTFAVTGLYVCRDLIANELRAKEENS